MFLDKYVSHLYLDIIYNNYDEEYLKLLDEENFIKIYELFRKYNFYFIEDIILNYLEIFEIDCEEVNNKILELKEKLGNEFVYIIGNNMTYLSEIID